MKQQVKLPPELRFKIADDVRQCKDRTSKATLRSLSLASKDWLAPSQEALFCTLSIYLAGCDDPIPGLTNSVTNISSAPKRLVRLLRSSPHLIPYIHHLYLSRHPMISYPWITISDILYLTSSIPRLRSLQFGDGVVVMGGDGGSALSSPKTINCPLVLKGIWLDIQSLNLLLSIFGGEHLELTEVTLISSHPFNIRHPPPVRPRQLSNLRTLHLKNLAAVGYHWSRIYEKVLMSMPPTLTTLSIEFHRPSKYYHQSFIRFLSACTRLLELRIDFTDLGFDFSEELSIQGFNTNPASWDQVLLSECCPELRKATFKLPVKRERDTLSSAYLYWSYALRLIESASQKLSSLRVALSIEPFCRRDLEEGIIPLELCTIGSVNWVEWDNALRKSVGLQVIFGAGVYPQCGEDPCDPHHWFSPLGRIIQTALEDLVQRKSSSPQLSWMQFYRSESQELDDVSSDALILDEDTKYTSTLPPQVQTMVRQLGTQALFGLTGATNSSRRCPNPRKTLSSLEKETFTTLDEPDSYRRSMRYFEHTNTLPGVPEHLQTHVRNFPRFLTT
ncbi:hypothetical protein BXZ70DRAFT_1013310 [Cristinia sonorae]|uniref:Uncharacterized protein n=1 Tax=Cristinia sonorae TaxID=1940300 RepID=A0A8K0XJX9_9AGAR|nr:hypothetical protein BXZ70DRAFT_1013310 [Cristinia sonorae]